jgi:hypothetical protein
MLPVPVVMVVEVLDLPVEQPLFPAQLTQVAVVAVEGLIIHLTIVAVLAAQES